MTGGARRCRRGVASHSTAKRGRCIIVPSLAQVAHCWQDGRGGQIRTGDPLHPMQVRYRAALRPAPTAVEYHIRLPDAIASRVGIFSTRGHRIFGPAADASAATPASHAIPIPASCSPSWHAPTASTARDTPNATPRSGSSAALSLPHRLHQQRQILPELCHHRALKIPPATIR